MRPQFLFKSIKSKLMVLILLILLFSALVFGYFSLSGLRENLYAEKKIQTMEMVQVGLGVLGQFHELEQSGEISREEAQLQARNILASMTYGPDKQDYLWIMDKRPVMLMHPYSPDLIGEYVDDIQDRDEKYIFTEMVDIVEMQGSGFLEYFWQYYDEEERSEAKLSYVNHFEPWDWIIGTGIYINEIQTSYVNSRNKFVLIGVLILLLGILLTYFVSNYFTRPVVLVTRSLEKLTEYDFDFAGKTALEKYKKRQDEIGDMVTGLFTMRQEISDMTEILMKQILWLEALFENSSSGIVKLDKNDNIIDINDNFQKTFDLQLEEIKGKNLIEALAGFIPDKVKKKKITQIAGEQKTAVILRDKWNKMRTYIVNRVPVIADDGEVKGNYVIYHDVTRLKETEKQLEINQFSVEKAAFLLFRVTPQGDFEYVNEAACQKLNYSREELLTMKVSDIDSDITPEERQKHWHLLKENKEMTMEREIRTGDGEVLPVQLTRNYLKFEDKEYEIAFMQDISQLKKRQKQVQRERDKLKNLHQAALKLNNAENDKEVCELTIDVAEKVLELDMCVVNLKEEQRFQVKAVSAGLSPREVSEYFLSQECLADICSRGENIIINDLENKKQLSLPVSEYRSFICIPFGDFGVFQALSNKKNKFSQQELQLIELLTTYTKETLSDIYFQQEIEYRAYHDELTDLYNRFFMEEKLTKFDDNDNLPVSIIMADINGLKIINETYGYQTGDEILIRVANILKSCVRSKDILARWAGDEFLILLPETGKKEAREIKNNISEECSRDNSLGIPISLGMGLATKYSDEGDIYEILNEANDNMYQDKLTKNRSATNKLVKNLLSTLGAKSNETKEHAQRMSELACKLGEKIGLSEKQLNKLSLLATLHDIGKVNISEDILKKPTSLTEEEWEVIKEHPDKGYSIASSIEEFASIADCIRAHHERWNGAGYPLGRKKEEIPLLSRIISIVDAFDVMTNGRAYKKAVDNQEALEELKRCAGSQFDPELVDEFTEIIEEEK